jgi:hypothetical protein
MKSYIRLALVIVAALFLLALNLHRKTDTRPSIYITRTYHILTMEGRDMWILEYTVNGELQGAMFHSQRAMTEYYEYLHTIGTVYQREAKPDEEGAEA